MTGAANFPEPLWGILPSAKFCMWHALVIIVAFHSILPISANRDAMHTIELSVFGTKNAMPNNINGMQCPKIYNLGDNEPIIFRSIGLIPQTFAFLAYLLHKNELKSISIIAAGGRIEVTEISESHPKCNTADKQIPSSKPVATSIRGI